MDRIINPKTGFPLDAGPWIFPKPVTEVYTWEIDLSEDMNEDEKEWLRSYARRYPERCSFKPEDIK